MFLYYLAYVISAIIVLLIFYSFRLLLIPAYYIMQYKNKLKQQIYVQYFPHIVSMNPMVRDFKQYKDCYYTYKRLVKENPSLKAIIMSVSSQPSIMFIDPELGKEVVNKNDYYIRVYNSTFAQKYLFSLGILTVSGNHWKQQRHILSKGFSFTQIQNRFPLVAQITNNVIEKVHQEYIQKSGRQKQPQSVRQLALNVTTDVSVKTFFIEGAPLTFPEELSKVLSESYYIASNNLCYKIKSFFFGSQFASSYLFSHQERKLYDKMINLQQTAYNIIKQRQEDSKNRDWERYIDKDVLDVYLRENNELKKQGKAMISDQEIIEQFLMLMSVGMEPPAASYAMCFYSLAKYPEYQTLLRDEINNTIPQVENLNFEDLSKIDLLHAFILESFRMYPSDAALIQKQAIKDHYIGEFLIKKGFIVNVSILATLYNEQYYEQPYRFWPERWINKSLRVDPYKYMVFSAGPRNCMGQQLSIMEAKIILINLLKKFEIQLNDKVELEMREEFSYNPYNDELIFLKPL